MQCKIAQNGSSFCCTDSYFRQIAKVPELACESISSQPPSPFSALRFPFSVLCQRVPFFANEQRHGSPQWLAASLSLCYFCNSLQDAVTIRRPGSFISIRQSYRSPPSEQQPRSDHRHIPRQSSFCPLRRIFF